MEQNDSPTVQRLISGGAVAIIRTSSAEHLTSIARALLEGGITSIEVTLTTPGAVAGIARLADELGQRALLGAGTVLDARSCREAISAGAQFIVSPGFDEAVHATVKEMGKASVPGAMTPTEILRAWTAGADLVKVFPSTVLGPGYLRDVLAPLPFIKLMPTGGVDASNVAEWLRAGAACVGVGSSVVSKDAVARRDWNAITASARELMQAIRDVEGTR